MRKITRMIFSSCLFLFCFIAIFSGNVVVVDIASNQALAEEQWGVKIYPDAIFNKELSIKYQNDIQQSSQLIVKAKAYLAKNTFEEVTSFYDSIYKEGINFTLENNKLADRIYYIGDWKNKGHGCYGLLILHLFSNKYGWLNTGSPKLEECQKDGYKTLIVSYKVIEDLENNSPAQGAVP